MNNTSSTQEEHYLARACLILCAHTNYGRYKGFKGKRMRHIIVVAVWPETIFRFHVRANST